MNCYSKDRHKKCHSNYYYSTVSAFNDTYYYPRYGYGTQLQQYFNIDNFKVENLALSGRSSKS
ncbi:MAG: hypothetical protein K5986_07010, partial [Clostridium sp.]|nr:hypothetical protein [Clostridium sp.]